MYSMTLEDEYRLLVSGYYGISEMYEYGSKEYILKEIEDYIRDFVKSYPLPSFDYRKEAENINDKLPLYRKLQDSILVLHKINGPMELILLVNEKLRELKDEEKA